MNLGGWQQNSYKLKHGVPLADAVGIDERNCVCVINELGSFSNFVIVHAFTYRSVKKKKI